MFVISSTFEQNSKLKPLVGELCLAYKVFVNSGSLSGSLIINQKCLLCFLLRKIPILSLVRISHFSLCIV